MEVGIGVPGGRGSHGLDDGVESFANELLAVFASLPDIEDTEKAGVEVEARRVNQESFGGVLKIERSDDCVVVGGAGVAVLDLELLEYAIAIFDSVLVGSLATVCEARAAEGVACASVPK